MFVKFKKFTRDMLFKLLVVACAACGVLLFAPRTMPVTGARLFTAGSRNEFHAF